MVKKIALMLVLVMFLGTSVFAADEAAKPDEKFFIFLCFGQSNMAGGEGPGPQDGMDVSDNSYLRKMTASDQLRQNMKMGQWYLTKPTEGRDINRLRLSDFIGWTVLENLPEGYKVGVINVSVPGCKIELFEKDTYMDYLSTAEQWMQSACREFDNNPYKRLVDVAKIAQKDGVIKGMCLHQGESNPNDDQWCNKVKGIYENLCKDLNLKAEEVPFFAGELKSAEQGGICAGFNTDVLKDLPSVLENSYIVSSKDCQTSGDGFHFSVKGYQQLGTNYGKKMLEVLGFEYKDSTEAEMENTSPAEQAITQ